MTSVSPAIGEAELSPPQESERARQWARRYPPLLSLAVAIVVAAVVLPSSLNIPQSTPSTTLEFAPVPPDKDKPPPPVGGNLGALGLGASAGLTSGGLAGGTGPAPAPSDPPPASPAGVGKSPRTKRCTGNPPRQTEDRLAPPCVADFSGNNFGATYQGVSGEEIRLLFYVQGFTRNVATCRDPNQITPDGEYFDLAQPPADDSEHCYVRSLRVWQQYFNDRYQTYGRFAHFFVYFSGAGASAEERKADAADNYNRIKPFAVVSTADSFNDAYLDSMSKRGVLAFDATPYRDETFFTKYPGRTWDYLPSRQFIAKMFGDLLCSQIVSKPVQDSGNAGENGGPRKYGLIYTVDPAHEELQSYKEILITTVRNQCGLDLAAVPSGTYPTAGWAQDNRYPPTYAQRAMTDFKGKGVTTIIWPGGLETQMSKAADAIGYAPEVIVTGDRVFENEAAATYQGQSFWNHVFMMTNLTAVASTESQPCYVAYRDTYPDGSDTDIIYFGCEVYDSVRQLFTGIQVAGPRLTPSAIDKGFHAIPRQASVDALTPACYYEQGDYTCVKDAMLEHWDRTAKGGRGCYRMLDSGFRYATGEWAQRNMNDGRKPTDPCNNYTTGNFINPNPPSATSPPP